MEPDIMRELETCRIRGGPLDCLSIEDVDALRDGEAMVVIGDGSPEEWLFAGSSVEAER